MKNLTGPSPSMRLRPGNGVLARHEDLVLLCEVPPGAEDSVRRILAEAKAAAGAAQPGRHLLRHLVKTLTASVDSFPSLCAFGAVDDGIAVAVHGNARLRVTMEDGELRLDGQDAVTIVDRLVASPVMSITGEIGEEIPGFCSWSELTSGVVRADALQYGTVDEDAPEDVEATSAEPPPRVESGDEEEDAAPPDDDADSQIVGVSCSKGHFNDPTDQYCGVCGIGLTQAGRSMARKERPSLGVLVLDDGMSLPLDKDYVLGREPEAAADVEAGEVMLLRLADPLVSGVHARIRPQGWQVKLFDEGSSNGTFVREPGSDWCVRVPSGGHVVLRPGAVVTVGHRQFRYDSHRRP